MRNETFPPLTLRERLKGLAGSTVSALQQTGRVECLRTDSPIGRPGGPSLRIRPGESNVCYGVLQLVKQMMPDQRLSWREEANFAYLELLGLHVMSRLGNLPILILIVLLILIAPVNRLGLFLVNRKRAQRTQKINCRAGSMTPPSFLTTKKQRT